MVPIDEGMLQPDSRLCKDTVPIPNCCQGSFPPALGAAGASAPPCGWDNKKPLCHFIFHWASGRLNLCINSLCCDSCWIMRLSITNFKTRAGPFFFLSGILSIFKCLFQFDNGLHFKDSLKKEGLWKCSEWHCTHVLCNQRPRGESKGRERDLRTREAAFVSSFTWTSCCSEETNLSSFCCSFWAPAWVGCGCYSFVW